MNSRPDFGKLAGAVLLALSLGAAAQSPDYLEGQRALERAEWARAREAFEKAQRLHAGEAEAALYWQAYALEREGRVRQAGRRVRELERRYPDGAWLDDARALGIDSGKAELQPGELDEELRLYALGRLLERDPERALPLLIELVENTVSERVRRDGVFLLGVSDAPDAQAAIARIARESEDPSLQMAAIHALAAADQAQAAPLLRSLLETAEDPGVLMAIAHAGMATEDAELLLSVLRRSDSPEVQNAAVHGLGAMGATDVLRDLYAEIDGRASRVAVLQAMAVAGDVEALGRILESENDPELRAMAIRHLPMAGEEDAADTLRAVYENPAGEGDRLAVLDALVLLDDDVARELAFTVAGNERDPRLVRRAVQTLSMLDATDALRSLYQRTDDQASRVAILQALAMADDAQGLAEVLRAEENPGLRAQAIRAMAMLDEELALTEELLRRYGEAGDEERQAVIDAMMMREDVDGLIALIERETSRERQRRLLHVLSMMDDEAAAEYLFEKMERDRD